MTKQLLPKTWEEYYTNNPDRLTLRMFVCEKSPKLEETYQAHMQLYTLRDYYRQGWTPNNISNGELIYKIVHIDGEIKVISGEGDTRFLSFQTKELALEFFENFKDLIEMSKELL